MDNKEALSKAIMTMIYFRMHFCKSREAVENAEEVIEALEKIEQTLCADAISRQTLKELGAECIAKRDENGNLIPLGSIDNLPTVSVAEKTGRWIYDRTRDWDGECKYECSECGMGSDVNYAYCMRCGCKMEVEE